MAERGRLEGRVAIVTGSGSDPEEKEGVATGYAIAKLFATEGASLTVLDIDEKRGRHTAMVIQEVTGRPCIPVVADTTSSADCESVVARTVLEFGRLDVLVNNVAIIIPSGGAVETREEDWDRTLLVNLKSGFLMTKYAIPRMVEGGGGSIVNISSIGAERMSGQCAYSTSKAAVNALTKDTAVTYGRSGVRANVIEPGWINTPMSHRYRPNLSPEQEQAAYEARRLSTPLGTEGTGLDIARAALFLASDDARWVTGIVMPVDGGVLAKSPSQKGE